MAFTTSSYNDLKRQVRDHWDYMMNLTNNEDTVSCIISKSDLEQFMNYMNMHPQIDGIKIYLTRQQYQYVDRLVPVIVPTINFQPKQGADDYFDPGGNIHILTPLDDLTGLCPPAKAGNIISI